MKRGVFTAALMMLLCAGAGCSCGSKKQNANTAPMPMLGVPELPVPEDYTLAVEKAIRESNYEKALASVEAELADDKK